MAKTLLKTLKILLILVVSAGRALSSGDYFVENRGQWNSDILFRTDLPGGFLFLKKNAFVFVFYDVSQVKAHHSNPQSKLSSRVANSPNGIKCHGVEVKFENCTGRAAPVGKAKASTLFNYFLGSDPSRWASDAGGFREIIYPGIYDGIDLRVYRYQSRLKYEFVVRPGADPGQIGLVYNGALGLALDSDGRAVVKTSVSEYKEASPYSFQNQGKELREVASHFRLSAGNRLSFSLPQGYAKTETLTIDPELIFSTFSGSTADNWGHTATYDDTGHLYSAGTVFGKNFPATVGAFQVQFAGQVDASVLKFSPDGSQLVYGTFLGGASTDVPSSLVVNGKGELLIYGATSSKDFPVKAGAYQTTFGGGFPVQPISGLDMPNGSDIFLSKLSNDGKQLLASTYFGGAGNDGISTEIDVGIQNYGDCFRGEIALTTQGDVLVVSSTNSLDFPLRNPVKNALGGRQDGVLIRIADNFNDLIQSTYFGGNGYDAGFSVKAGKGNDLYVAGITQSSDLAVHSSSLQLKLSGTEDGYVIRLTDGKLSEATYLGTSSEDGAYLLDVDPGGNVYVYGLSKGKYPVSSGVYSNANSGQFVHAIDATLSKTIFSTVLGSGRGLPDISPTAFLVSECGNIYLAGWGGEVNVFNGNNPESSTRGLPVTGDAIQPGTSGNNFYIAILEESAKSLLYATYFGSNDAAGLARGDHVDGGTSRFDKNGMIYHATCACGGSYFPATPKAWSLTNNSDNCNNAAFKIDIDRLVADFDIYEGSKKDVTKGCAPLSLSFINTSAGGKEFLWQINGNTISRDDEQAAYVFAAPGEYTVVLKAYNRLSCKREDVATKKIIVESLDAQVKADTAVCENTPVRLWASGGSTYKWSPAAFLDNALVANPTANIKQTTEFTVEISNVIGCKVTRKVVVMVERKGDLTVSPDTEACSGASVTLTASGEAQAYVWQGSGILPNTTGNHVIVQPGETTTYLVQATYADGCKPIREITVKVDKSYAPSFNIGRREPGCNEPVKYTFVNTTPNAQRYEWVVGPGNLLQSKDVTDFVFDRAGNYDILLTAYNASGCSLTVQKKLEAEPAFVLSNVITPNGDGKNDYFVVPVAQSRLEVFNRWGKSVFLSENYQNNWGKKVPNGTYYFVVDTPAGSHCKGWVEVLE
jgi:gliding motility-associated-like protein